MPNHGRHGRHGRHCPAFSSSPLAVLICLISLIVATPRQAALAQNTRPNIVLIIGDDQAWNDYGFMGHPHIKTPRLDRLAAEGRLYRRGSVVSSLCSPSLATILTGLYPHQHGITSNDPARPPGSKGQDRAWLEARARLVRQFDNLPSLPRQLAPLGYLSLQTGKWWGGDFKRGGFTHGMSHGDPARGGRHGDAGLEIGRETMKPITDFLDLATREKKPFFLWYAPMLPHTPHNPPPQYLDLYRQPGRPETVARYMAMCTWFDATCGQLLDELHRRQLSTNTLVVFLADNGWIQDPKAERYAPRSKQSPYDGGLRTPIILRWPGHLKPGAIDTPVSSIDIAPTILTAAGARPAQPLPGVDLLNDQAVQSRPAIFGEIFTHDAADLDKPAASLRFRYVVEGPWKLIKPHPANEPLGRVELFDVVADPWESRDRSADDPAIVDRLSRQLDQWWLPDR